MFYRLSAGRTELATTVADLLALNSKSQGWMEALFARDNSARKILRRLETLFTVARTAKVDVFAGGQAYQIRWRFLLKKLDQADRVRLLTDYIGADKLDEYDPSCLSPANVTEFVECIDGDEDGQPLGWISNFLQKRLQWTPLTPPRLQGAELRAVLSQLGEVHEVPLGKNKNSVAVLLKLAEVKKFLGVEDLAEVFAGVEGLRQESGEKNGFIADVDLYQQRVLLAAIVNVGAIHELPLHSLGFYNLRGSRKLYEVLSAQGFYERTGIYWVWTGEKYEASYGNSNTKAAEDQYLEPGIVTLENIVKIRGSRFVFRFVGNDYWGVNVPANHDENGGVVVGFFEDL